MVGSRPLMFETLTKGFRSAKQRFQGVAELDEATVDEALTDVRTALLEADVGFDVVQDFCKRVKEKAVGVIVKVKASSKEKVRRVTAEDHFVKLCHDELVDLMGPVDTSLKFAKKGPTGIMMVGLQGSGKTTTIGKLARFLEKQHKRPCWSPPTSTARPPSISSRSSAGSWASRSTPSPGVSRRRSASGPFTSPPRAGATSSSSTPPAGWRSTSC